MVTESDVSRENVIKRGGVDNTLVVEEISGLIFEGTRETTTSAVAAMVIGVVEDARDGEIYVIPDNGVKNHRH